MLTIKFDDRTVKLKLKELENKLKNTKKPLNEVGDILLRKFGNDNFINQGRFIGERWKPLSPVTLLARQKRQGYYKKTPLMKGKALIWTGNLKSGFRKKVNRYKLEIFNVVKYFKYHQTGKNKRPMIGINKNVIKIVEGVFKKYFKL